MGIRVGMEGGKEEVTNASRLEGAGGLEVFEFEEDAAGEGISGGVLAWVGREHTSRRLWRGRRTL